MQKISMIYKLYASYNSRGEGQRKGMQRWTFSHMLPVLASSFSPASASTLGLQMQPAILGVQTHATVPS